MKKIILKILISIIVIFFFANNADAQFNLLDLLENQNVSPKPTSNESFSENDFIVYWQTNTLVPPYYKGRALPSRNSTINISVIFLKKIDTSNFIFQLYVDEILKDYGRGKTQLQFSPSIGRGDQNIFLRIYNSNIVATKSIRIPIVQPEINIYSIIKNYFKIYLNEKIKYHFNPDKEANFLAEPYYFNVPDPKILTYSWKFGDSILEEDKNNKNLNLKINFQSQETMSEFLELKINNPLNFETQIAKIQFLIFKEY